MIGDLIKALKQLPDPTFRKVLVRGVGLTAVAFVVVVVALWQFVGHLALLPIPWVNEILAFGTFVIFVLLLFLVFPAIATMLISVYLDEIIEAVDRRHYAAEPSGRPLPFARSLALSARFTGVVIGINLLVLPFYLLLFFVTPINLFIYYALNGYLLSREYFELVALRHLDVASTRKLRKAHQGRLMTAGVIIAFLLTVPIVNIAAPVIAAAFMEHLFRRLHAASGVAVARADQTIA